MCSSDLSQARVSLRVRKDGKRRIQTVKCAPTVEDGINVRREWEREVEAERPVVKGLGDKQLRKLLGAGQVRGRLAPQFVTDFRRATWPLKVRDSEARAALAAVAHRIRILELEGEVFFGTAEGLRKEIEALPADTQVVVLDFRQIGRAHV